jgi:hypothetical protein
MKKIFIIFLIAIVGCSSIPKRNLSTSEGVIAAHFNLSEDQVDSLRGKDLSDEEIVKVLIISTGSYLTSDEILEIRKGDKTLEEIGEEAGIEPEILEGKTRELLQQISTY